MLWELSSEYAKALGHMPTLPFGPCRRIHAVAPLEAEKQGYSSLNASSSSPSPEIASCRRPNILVSPLVSALLAR